jgi:hypothetical protein
VSREKREQVGADTFVAAGLAEGNGFDQLPREEVAHQLERHGDEFLVRWPAHRVECAVTGLREHSDGVAGELSVSHGGVELHWGRLSLASSQTREGVVRKLNTIVPDLPWRSILEVTCRATARALRESTATVALRGRRATGPRHLIDPVAPLGQIAVGFGDGGAGKGNLAVAFALAVGEAVSLPGAIYATARCPVLYLDWETDQDDLDDRVALLARGFSLAAVTKLHYRRMVRPLTEEASALRAEVSRLGIGFVIIDSLAVACGSEPEGADAAIRTHAAMRSLGPVTCWCVAHVTKAGADQRGPGRPFGSVFVQNLARSVWEIRRSEDDQAGDELRMALFHRKVNGGRLHAPIALRFHFASDAVSLHGADIAEAPDLLARTSVGSQVIALLRPGAKTAAGLAEELGISVDTVSRTLRRLAKPDNARVVRLSPEGVTGRGAEALWGLRTSKADT